MKYNITHFGVLTTNDGKELLFCAQEGSFASSAWRKSDAEYNQIAGQSFLALTSDDGEQYNIGRHNIRRIKDEQELTERLNNSCTAFRLKVRIQQYKTKDRHCYVESHDFIDNVPHLLEKFSDTELEEYFVEHFTEK